jgi:hypothetical protein
MKKILIFFLVYTFFSSCKNELKLNAPYKEIPSIYAVLCPQEKLHIIRVNKVFLGEGDANVMAKVADSVNYPAGELTITLDRFVNGKQVNANQILGQKTIFFRDSIIQTQNGAFSTTQRVYVANADLHEALPYIEPNKIKNPFSVNTNGAWKVSGDYVLTVKNNKTGNVFTAKSTIVDSVRPNQLFAPFIGYYYPPEEGAAVDGNNYIAYQELEKQYTISYPINESKIYQVSLKMHFYDDKGVQGKGPYQSIEYPFNNQFSDNEKTTVGIFTLMRVNFKGKDLFGSFGNALSRMNLGTNILGRKMYKIEYNIYSSTQDYADYLEFSKPSFGITQNQVLYSNFQNQSAIGIFTFRSRCRVFKAMDKEFVSEFQRNSNTCKYQFFNADESRVSCQ